MALILIFTKSYNEKIDEEYFPKVEKLLKTEKLRQVHDDLPFLPERMKIKKVKKLVPNSTDKTEYVIHIRNLKRVLNHGLVLKKVHRVITFNQKAWLKSNVDMNTDLGKEAKSDFKKDFFKLMNNALFGKTMENVRKYRIIKLVTTERRRNYLVTEPNYHTAKFFTEN